MNRTICGTALAAAMLVLQGCASPGAAIDKDAQARVASERPEAPRPEDFPDLGSAKWKQGAFPGTDAFARMNLTFLIDWSLRIHKASTLMLDIRARK